MSYRCSTRFKPPKTSPESLAFALDGAAHAVDAVRAGGALPAALARIFTRIDAPAARGALQDLACRALRAAAASAFFGEIAQGASAKTVWRSMRGEQVSIAKRWRRPRSELIRRARSDTRQAAEKCAGESARLRIGVAE